jgi:hypothetical protein
VLAAECELLLEIVLLTALQSTHLYNVGTAQWQVAQLPPLHELQLEFDLDCIPSRDEVFLLWAKVLKSFDTFLELH